VPKKPYLKSDVTQEMKDQFAAKARELGRTEAGLLRLLIETFLKTNPVEVEIPAPTETKDNYLPVRLSSATKGALLKRASEHRMKTGPYVLALLRAHLSQKPSFTEIELEVLRQTNNELTAIGRNVNQIARALNISIDNVHLVKANEMESVARKVKECRDYVRNLIRANLASWGIERDKEKY